MLHEQIDGRQQRSRPVADDGEVTISSSSQVGVDGRV